MKHKKIIWILYFFLIVASVVAYPVPLGLDGTVYDVDGVTKADQNVMFSMENLDSGFYVEDNLRIDGTYSATIKGNSGDTVMVKVWTDYHQNSESLVIQGVMHNFDLILNLSQPNTPPEIISSPVLNAYEDSLYEYQVGAVDENTLSYSVVGPQRMNIDNETGLITWTPDVNDIGEHNVLIKVSDGTHTVEQSYSLEVIEVNDAPVITSNPVTTATAQRLYEYATEATDEDSEDLQYELLEKPQGMTINLNVISWIPQQTGYYNVTVAVYDNSTGATQTYTIIVNEFENFNPTIISEPVTSVLEDEQYFYDVDAEDADGDDIAYSLEQAPQSMNINNVTGEISWLPENGDTGTQDIRIKAQDNYGGYDVQNYTLQVININDAPVITSEPILTAYQWNLYKYDVDAFDEDGDTLTYSLVERERFMFINPRNGNLFWLPLEPGTFRIVVKVDDSELDDIQVFYVTVSEREGYLLTTSSKDTVQVKTTTNNDRVYTDSDNRNLDILATKQEIDNVKPKDNLYKYLIVNSLDEQDSIISFKVDKNWLGQNDSKDVVLYYYELNGEKWVEQSTSVVDEDNDNYYYESDVDNLGVFAVALKKDWLSLQKEMKQKFYAQNTTYLKSPFVITGRIFLSENIPALQGLEYKIMNLRTNDTVKGQTQSDLNTYAEVVNGRIGDDIEITVGKGSYEEKIRTKITGDVVKLDIHLGLSQEQFKRLSYFTDNKIFSYAGYFLLLLIPIMILIRLVVIKYKRK